MTAFSQAEPRRGYDRGVEARTEAGPGRGPCVARARTKRSPGAGTTGVRRGYKGVRRGLSGARARVRQGVEARAEAGPRRGPCVARARAKRARARVQEG